MHENNYPSNEFVQISSLMNPLDVEGKLGHVLEYGQKFSSDFRYDRAQKHWDNTLTYLNEAIRQTLREGLSKEKFESLLQTDDNTQSYTFQVYQLHTFRIFLLRIVIHSLQRRAGRTLEISTTVFKTH